MSAIRLATVLTVCGLSAAFAQSGSPFGGFKHDSRAPIEITADSLEVRQSEQLAIFSGNVVAGQGTLRLTANEVKVFYVQESSDADTGAISKLDATGNVFLSNGAETAKGARATYDVKRGMVEMSGNVILTQGDNAASGETLEIDLNTGVGRITSGVQVIFKPATQDN
ncbi:MAG: lipopolysaccharide transport periplasmic protein LptA [Pseudomonadota bacterium]